MVRFRNIFHSHLSESFKEQLHVESKDFRLWCSGGVYEPADADI